MDGVQTAVVSTCISCKTGTWRHVVLVCVCLFVCLCMCLHYALFGTFSQRGVCYPCLLESDPRLCLIGVFTLSGLTHTDMLDLGSPPFAMKKKNSDTETCLLLCGAEKLFCYLFLFFFLFVHSAFLLLPLSASRHCCSLFSIWRDELFNHRSMIQETCSKVITVSQHCVAAWHILYLNYMHVAQCTCLPI